MDIKLVVYVRHPLLKCSGLEWNVLVVRVHKDGRITAGSIKHPWQRDDRILRHMLLRAHGIQGPEAKKAIELILKETP